MALYMIGVGLNDEKDISIRGLEAVKKCDKIFLEGYTSRLDCSKHDLEKFYSKKIILADRDMVEKNSDKILGSASDNNVAFLVVGDVFSATTHIDLYMRAKKRGIDIKVIHNASILTAVGVVGLELYKYGKTTSMPFFEKSFRPETPYEVIKNNKNLGLHTLVLLDIKKDRLMTINQAIEQLLTIEEKRKECIFTTDLKIVGCARLGAPDFKIKYGTFSDLFKEDFGPPLHCIIIPGKLHFVEEEMLAQWQ